MEGGRVRRGLLRGLASIIVLALLTGTVGHAGQSPRVIADVRAAIAQQDFARGEKPAGEELGDRRRRRSW